MLEHILLDLLAFFIVGSIAGILSGLLGIGGGMIVVPTLAWLFHYFDFTPESIMHLAAGTSLAVMSLAMIRALLAHRRYHVEYWSVFRYWIIPVAISAVLGVVVAHQLHSAVLTVILAAVMLLIAIKMFLPEFKGVEQRQLPGAVMMTLSGGFIGVFSAMLGIGGSVLILPYLTYFNLDIRRAVVVSIATSLTIAIVGTIAAVLVGWHRSELPPQAIGYVYWPAWIGVAFGSLLFIPVGTALSHRLPVPVLRKIFAIILLLMGADLLLKSYL